MRYVALPENGRYGWTTAHGAAHALEAAAVPAPVELAGPSAVSLDER